MNADAWAIHFGNGYRTCTFDRGRAAEIATQLHGTVHPMVYLENVMQDEKTEEARADQVPDER
jgi:hypothetical protein